MAYSLKKAGSQASGGAHKVSGRAAATRSCREAQRACASVFSTHLVGSPCHSKTPWSIRWLAPGEARRRVVNLRQLDGSFWGQGPLEPVFVQKLNGFESSVAKRPCRCPLDHIFTYRTHLRAWPSCRRFAVGALFVSPRLPRGLRPSLLLVAARARENISAGASGLTGPRKAISAAPLFPKNATAPTASP